MTKYADLVCAQSHRQELIQNLYKTWHDLVRGTVSGDMISDLLISYRKAAGTVRQEVLAHDAADSWVIGRQLLQDFFYFFWLSML